MSWFECARGSARRRGVDLFTILLYFIPTKTKKKISKIIRDLYNHFITNYFASAERFFFFKFYFSDLIL